MLKDFTLFLFVFLRVVATAAIKPGTFDYEIFILTGSSYENNVKHLKT
jgi:hypothetical protein